MENNPANDQTETLNYAERKKLVKELLDWCYDHTFMKNLRAKKGNKDTLLHWACENGKLEIVEYLFEENRIDNANRLGDNDETPLHKAARDGHDDIVKYLIDKKANIEAQNSDCQTPLILALKKQKRGTLEVVKSLVEKGANVNARDWNYSTDTALELIIKIGLRIFQKQNFEIAKLLIANGANVNIRNNTRETLLHIVACGDHKWGVTKDEIWFQTEISKLLLDKGLNINAKEAKSVPLCM